MKKILVALLVLTAFWLNTYNVWAFTDSQTSKTNAYYLKIDKILDKFFIKVDKRWEAKAKIISRIDILVKKSKSDKKTKILNYIKVKFVDKLKEIIKKEEVKKYNTTKRVYIPGTKKIDTTNAISDKDVGRTNIWNWRWTMTNWATTSNSERERIIKQNSTHQTVDEAILKSENVYTTTFIRDEVLSSSSISLNWIKANMLRIKALIDSWRLNSQTKFSDDVLKVLKADYNKAYHFLYEWWILEETSADWILSRSWYSWYENLVYYYAEWDKEKKQVLRDLWYREWKGTIKEWRETFKNVIYKDELNILKQKYDVPKYK